MLKKNKEEKCAIPMKWYMVIQVSCGTEVSINGFWRAVTHAVQSTHVWLWGMNPHELYLC